MWAKRFYLWLFSFKRAECQYEKMLTIVDLFGEYTGFCCTIFYIFYFSYNFQNKEAILKKLATCVLCPLHCTDRFSDFFICTNKGENRC